MSPQRLTGELPPQNESGADLVALYRQYVDAVASLLQQKKASYDTLTECTITHLGQNKLLTLAALRTHLDDTINDARRPETWQETQRAYQAVEAINPRYCPLLVDLALGLRLPQFLAFAAKNRQEKPLELRKKFIASFPTETYYRGVTFLPGQSLRPLSHLAPKVADAVTKPNYFQQTVGSKAEYNLRYAQKDDRNAYLLSPLFLEESILTAQYHVLDRQTHGPYISLSQYPEVSWYVLCDNEEKLWRRWPKGQFLRVYRFRMNSFYALPAAMTRGDFAGVTLKMIDGKKGKWSIPRNDPGVEQLAPISIPPDFDLDFRDYRPERGAFALPHPQDWE